MRTIRCLNCGFVGNYEEHENVCGGCKKNFTDTTPDKPFIPRTDGKPTNGPSTGHPRKIPITPVKKDPLQNTYVKDPEIKPIPIQNTLLIKNSLPKEPTSLKGSTNLNEGNRKNSPPGSGKKNG